METLTYQKFLLQTVDNSPRLCKTLKQILIDLSASEIRELEYWMYTKMRHACNNDVRDMLEEERGRKLVFLDEQNN